MNEGTVPINVRGRKGTTGAELPNITFVDWVHGRSPLALECLCKRMRIAQRAYDSVGTARVSSNGTSNG